MGGDTSMQFGLPNCSVFASETEHKSPCARCHPEGDSKARALVNTSRYWCWCRLDKMMDLPKRLLANKQSSLRSIHSRHSLLLVKHPPVEAPLPVQCLATVHQCKARIVHVRIRLTPVEGQVERHAAAWTRPSGVAPAITLEVGTEGDSVVGCLGHAVLVLVSIPRAYPLPGQITAPNTAATSPWWRWHWAGCLAVNAGGRWRW